MIMSVVKGTDGGRAELADGECHRAEKLAGVVVLSFHTFLFGHAVFCGIDKILSGAFNSDDGEKPESNDEFITVGITYRAAGNTAANGFGNIIALAAAPYTVGVADYL